MNKEVKNRIFGTVDEFERKLKIVAEDDDFLHNAQIEHYHGFEGERHNVHTKRYKFLIPALERYYQDVCIVEELKARQSAKI